MIVLLDALGFLGEHNRDIVFNLVQQFAFFTDKAVLVLHLYRSFALRTGQNFQQILIYHRFLSFLCELYELSGHLDSIRGKVLGI